MEIRTGSIAGNGMTGRIRVNARYLREPGCDQNRRSGRAAAYISRPLRLGCTIAIVSRRGGVREQLKGAGAGLGETTNRVFDEGVPLVENAARGAPGGPRGVENAVPQPGGSLSARSRRGQARGVRSRQGDGSDRARGF